MLFSISVIILVGMLMGNIFKRIKFPALFGMILAGILIGPYMLNLIDDSILNISSQIRKIALIIILIRAGLKLSFDDLKKVGRPAILMCFLPACLEILGMIIIAPKLLGIDFLEAAIMGAVVAAVSPAVIVPTMIKLIDEGYGIDKGIPQMVLAGASVDDVFVIVLFTTFTSLATGGSVNIMSFVNIPLSIIIGMIGGMICGYLLCKLFNKVAINDIAKVMIVLSAAFILTYIEDTYTFIPFASLIGVMAMGLMIKKTDLNLSLNLSGKYDHMWSVAEIFLFVLVGASVAIDSALKAGAASIVLILGVLVFRMAGVILCLIGTPLNRKEKLFTMFAYMPKATVQAAIGGVPLSMGLPCGQIVLTVSVIAILVSAPLGAFILDLTYKKLLNKA